MRVTLLRVRADRAGPARAAHRGQCRPCARPPARCPSRCSGISLGLAWVLTPPGFHAELARRLARELGRGYVTQEGSPVPQVTVVVRRQGVAVHVAGQQRAARRRSAGRDRPPAPGGLRHSPAGRADPGQPGRGCAPVTRRGPPPSTRKGQSCAEPSSPQRPATPPQMTPGHRARRTARGAAGPAGHRRIHRPRPRRPAVPAQPPGIPARRDPVRRRPLLRQRAAAGPRGPAVPRLHHRAAARHHRADVAGGAARPGDRDGLGHGRGPDPHRGGQLGGRAAHRPAAARPGPARGDPGVRHAGHLPGQPGRRAHGAAGAVADTVLPGRRAGCAGRRPARGQWPAAGRGRCGVRVRRVGRGVGHPAGRRGGGILRSGMPGAPPGSWPGWPPASLSPFCRSPAAPPTALQQRLRGAAAPGGPSRPRWCTGCG